jgi:hypothetical protein
LTAALVIGRSGSMPNSSRIAWAKRQCPVGSQPRRHAVHGHPLACAGTKIDHANDGWPPKLFKARGSTSHRVCHRPTCFHSRDRARRARRLAHGLPDADRDRLLAYAEELDGEAAATGAPCHLRQVGCGRRGSGETASHSDPHETPKNVRLPWESPSGGRRRPAMVASHGADDVEVALPRVPRRPRPSR